MGATSVCAAAATYGLLAGLTFPNYFGALVVALLMRNICDKVKPSLIHTKELNVIGEISLNLFLGIAMITLKLWQMANMQAVTRKYGPSVKAYLLVPVVGGMFADIINSLTITLFINMI